MNGRRPSSREHCLQRGAPWAPRWPGWCLRIGGGVGVCHLGLVHPGDVESIRRWPPRPIHRPVLPAERLWGGMLNGLRFAWHSDLILAQLVRVMAFGAAGSACGRCCR